MPGRRFRDLFISILILAVATTAGAETAAPPIVKRQDIFGNKLRTQTYQAGPVLLDPDGLNFAVRYRATKAWGGKIPAAQASIICEIDDDGSIDTKACLPVSWKNRAQVLAASLVRQSTASLDWPVLPPIDRAAAGLPRRLTNVANGQFAGARRGETTPFYRRVALQVRIPELDRPDIDLTTGSLVELKELTFLGPNSVVRTSDYPSKALIERKEGLQTIECQIQIDHSIICRTAAFDPPGNEPYFEETAEQIYKQATVERRLKSGANASGVRFRQKLRWKVPSDR
jgi:hypothetical protein